MVNTETMRIINGYIQEICHFSQMQVFATSAYQKKYFQMQIDEEVLRLVDYMMNNKTDSYPVLQNQQMTGQQEMRIITKEELANNDGSSGKPAYVAVNGNVYDVTMVIQWAGGTHFGLYSGHELTNEFMGCHKGMLNILQKLPIVGILR